VPTHEPADDLSLLQRIAARDDAALAELYDRHHRPAFAIIRRIVQSPSDAEEVLQETSCASGRGPKPTTRGWGRRPPGWCASRATVRSIGCARGRREPT
jgi:DNA-directed RNA polymerase specialized sigma24 family protein